MKNYDHYSLEELKAEAAKEYKAIERARKRLLVINALRLDKERRELEERLKDAPARPTGSIGIVGRPN